MIRLKLINTPETQKATHFEVLLSAVMDRLWGFALRLTRKESEAEDLFQEAVLKACREFPHLRDRERFKPWIFQILHRQWIGMKRSETRTPFVDLPYDEEMSPDSTSSNPWDVFPWKSVDGKMGELVQEEVDKLTPEFRQVVWLRYVEDLDYREIAKVLDITEGTVASRLFRARGLLKERLWQYASENGWVKER